MNGVMFGGEGPVMQGTWYNPQTGDAFTVRDSFFEDNQYVVSTTDGRYLYYNQLQNFVQTDMKLEELKKMKAERNKPKEEALPAEVAGILEGSESEDTYNSYLLPDEDVLTRGLGNLADRHKTIYNNVSTAEHTYKTEINTPKEPAPISMNAACIEKALKNALMPKFNIELNWPDYPTKNIEMLKDIMDIPMEEILDWYLERIDMLEIAENIKSIMKKHILGDVKEEIVPVSPALSREDLMANTEKVKKDRKTTKKS